MHKLIENRTRSTHASVIRNLLKGADHFDCIVAFAKVTGLEEIEDDLEAHLKKGKTARFVVGLNFGLTDPSLLQCLLEYQAKEKKGWGTVEAYVSVLENCETFHPKLYRFRTGKRAKLLVGSANMTGGGLVSNHELSLLVEGADSLVASIDRFIKEAEANKEIVKLNPDVLKDYRKRHALFALGRRKANKYEEMARELETLTGLDVFKNMLEVMKADAGRDGFDKQVAQRQVTYAKAVRVLDKLAVPHAMDRASFDKLYQPLTHGLWHSGSLYRSDSKIGRTREAFRELVRVAKRAATGTDRDLEAVFDQAKRVDGAGLNILTEILHTYNRDRFPIMNQNSVDGINSTIDNASQWFPPRPGKNNTDHLKYLRFIECANTLKQALGLENFSQLDAVCNFKYWRS